MKEIIKIILFIIAWLLSTGQEDVQEPVVVETEAPVIVLEALGPNAPVAIETPSANAAPMSSQGVLDSPLPTDPPPPPPLAETEKPDPYPLPSPLPTEAPVSYPGP